MEGIKNCSVLFGSMEGAATAVSMSCVLEGTWALRVEGFTVMRWMVKIRFDFEAMVETITVAGIHREMFSTGFRPSAVIHEPPLI